MDTKWAKPLSKRIGGLFIWS